MWTASKLRPGKESAFVWILVWIPSQKCHLLIWVDSFNFLSLKCSCLLVGLKPQFWCWVIFKPSLHSPSIRNTPHLTDSLSSTCLVNYSRLLNNWGARKYESFTATACIRSHGYSDTSWTRLSHVPFFWGFINGPWQIYLHFLYMVWWKRGCQCGNSELKSYVFILAGEMWPQCRGACWFMCTHSWICGGVH